MAVRRALRKIAICCYIFRVYDGTTKNSVKTLLMLELLSLTHRLSLRRYQRALRVEPYVLKKHCVVIIFDVRFDVSGVDTNVADDVNAGKMK